MQRFILIVVLAAGLTAGFSRLIDRLYSGETRELSFPDRLRERAVLRCPLLFVGCVLALSRCDTAFPIAGVFDLCFYLSLLFISVTDWEQYIIFDSVVGFLAAAGIVQSLTAAYLTEYVTFPTAPVIVPPPLEAVLSGLAAGGIMLLLAMLMRGSIFGGDIKLVTALGMWLGVGHTPSAVAFGFVLGGLAAAFLLIATKKNRQDFFAYGPYFAIAAAVVRATGITL